MIGKILMVFAFILSGVAIYQVLEETDFATKTGELFSLSSLLVVFAIVFWIAGEIFSRKEEKDGRGVCRKSSQR